MGVISAMSGAAQGIVFLENAALEGSSKSHFQATHQLDWLHFWC